MVRRASLIVLVFLFCAASAWPKWKPEEQEYLDSQFRTLQEQIQTLKKQNDALTAQVAQMRQDQAEFQLAMVREQRKLDELEQPVGPPAQLPAREAEVAPVDDDVRAHRQLGVERVLLRHDPEPGADERAVALRIKSEDAERPSADRRDAADHPHRRALAGPVRAEEAERLAACDVEVDPVDGGQLAEALDESAGMDEWAGGGHGADTSSRP